MTNETDTVSEVARVADVLTDHPDWYITDGSTPDDIVFGCQGCTVEVWRDQSGLDGGDLTQPRKAFAQHQAAVLAEAGLLREEASLAAAFESGARHYAASDPCCGTYHLHEIENPHTGEAIPTREGEDDL